MKNRRPLKPKGRKNLPDELIKIGRHIVYTEGTRTEPYYVMNIKRCIANKYMCSENDIEIVQGSEDSKNTKFLFDFAKNDVLRRLSKNEIVDHAWIFFDKDDFPISNFKSAHKMIEQMNNSNTLKNTDGFSYNIETNVSWHSCWSNESFELWLLLYFEYMNSSLNRKQYIEKINSIPSLKNIGFDYKKSLKDIHTILTNNGGSIDRAINNADKLNKSNGKEISNPSTGVVEFARFFKPYISK